MSEFATSIGEGSSEPAHERRVVTADLEFVVAERAEVVVQVMASDTAGRVLTERFDVNVAGRPSPESIELVGPHGARVQVFDSPPGRLTISYRSEIEHVEPQVGPDPDPDPPGEGAPDAGAAPSGRPGDLERLVYLRPSRYCPSDHLVGFAVAEFGTGPSIRGRAEAVTDWIRERVGYVAGSSSVHDSAEDTLLTGMGTCRDFAHLGVALCRAVGIPARFAAVYAPGLFPMDFHAVFECMGVDGVWYAYDATDLAPRQSMVRIVTGRDAADAAFASINKGIATLQYVEVSATTGGALPVDHHWAQVQLA
jgi:transglutaminase-like putative cysteine protease